MKRIGLFILTLFLCVLMDAQTHMKFMGIPLDGTIESFSQKLKAKGITYDAVTSRKLSPGAKLYKGLFMGENAEFMVMFNAKSRIVYGVGVELSYSSVEFAKTPFYNIAEGIQEKYPTATYDRIEDDDNAAIGVNFMIPEAEKEGVFGVISQTLSRPDDLKTYWRINLLYLDVKNSLKNDKINNDDL